MRPDISTAGDAGEDEWINLWAAARDNEAAAAAAQTANLGRTNTLRGLQANASRTERSATMPQIRLSKPIPDDQLTRDIADIERVRDALAAAHVPQQRLQAFMLVPSRTTDSVPLLIGGVMALVMLTLLGAAAALTKVAR